MSAASGASEAPPSPGPLTGLLVADFSRVLAGPYATMLLADLGADVIKVESPAGDDTRHWMPPVTADGTSTYYLAINRNKRSVVLDLALEADRTLAVELARRCDIFVENFKPGGLAKFGLDYASVCAVNEPVIYASVSGFGSAGGASLAGYDLLVQAISGLMSLSGDPDGPPYRAGVAIFDIIAGLHTALGVLAALAHRTATGQGQHLETSLMASAMSGLVNQASAVVAGGVVPFRMGNAHPSLFPYEPLPTADGELVITAGNDSQFRKLCDVLGAPELATDSRFRFNNLRTLNRDDLRPLLIERLAERTSAEWFAVLAAAGVPCAPINTIDKGIAFATEIGLDPVVLAGAESGAGVPVMRHPVTFSVTPPRYDLAPPGLDEHGESIRAWLAQPEASARPEVAGGARSGDPADQTGETT
jgi:crotonobetainyl-CoA:carnitine CoA-transferase CaiB-like acyl-CoA transferase